MKEFIVRENTLSDGSSTFDVILQDENGEQVEVVNAHNEYHARLCCEDLNLIVAKYNA